MRLRLSVSVLSVLSLLRQEPAADLRRFPDGREFFGQVNDRPQGPGFKPGARGGWNIWGKKGIRGGTSIGPRFFSRVAPGQSSADVRIDFSRKEGASERFGKLGNSDDLPAFGFEKGQKPGDGFHRVAVAVVHEHDRPGTAF